jgi:hypothetical protein
MNGSADCDSCSQTATDEEPPGPLDLSLSILSTDLNYGAESASVDTALSLTPGFRHTPEAVATATLPLAANYPADGFDGIAAPCDPADNGAAGNTLACLKHSTRAGTRPGTHARPFQLLGVSRPNQCVLRATTAPDSWSLGFTVLSDGAPIGVIRCFEPFPVTSSTPSVWL